MHYFFSRDIRDGFIYFTADETKHLQKSLRMRPGHEVLIMDGNGTHYLCELEQTKGQIIRGLVRDTFTRPVRKCHLHLAISPVKQMSRFEWFLEKSVEIGVEAITPVWCRRSVRTRLRMSRLEKVAAEALKQSGQYYLPRLFPPMEYDEFLKRNHSIANRYISYCGKKNLPLLSDMLPLQSPALVCIGPEGDFTSEEVEEAVTQGFKPVSLGDYRLRTETAGIYVCTIVKTLNDRIHDMDITDNHPSVSSC